MLGFYPPTLGSLRTDILEKVGELEGASLEERAQAAEGYVWSVGDVSEEIAASEEAVDLMQVTIGERSSAYPRRRGWILHARWRRAQDTRNFFSSRVVVLLGFFFIEDKKLYASFSILT